MADELFPKSPASGGQYSSMPPEAGGMVSGSTLAGELSLGATASGAATSGETAASSLTEAPVERIPTGIQGLDELIEGGIIKGRTLLLTGASGTGKTTLALQFLYSCALRGRPVVHVALEEKPKNFRKDMLRFNMNIDAMEKNGTFTTVSGSEAIIGVTSEEKEKLHIGFDIQRLIQKILDVSKKSGAEIVCIDSLPALMRYLETEADIRKAILELSYILSERGLTVVLITGATGGNSSQFGIEDYIADAVFVLQYGGMFKGEKTSREFFIRKMRGTQHSEEFHALRIITGKGIVIKPPEAE